MALQNLLGNIALDATVTSVVNRLLEVISTLKAGVPQADNKISYGSVNTSSSWSVQYAAPNVAGTGYAVGDTITLGGNSPTEAAILTVSSIGASGAITGLTVNYIGKYPSTFTSATQASTSGSGTGATFTITPAQNVACMFDTTGYNQVQFQYTTWSGGVTSVQGSIDGGKTWNNIPFYFNDSPVLGVTGSASNVSYNYIPQPWPLVRITTSGNNTIHYSLRSLNQQSQTVKQGGNTGSNQIWYTANTISNFSRSPGHTSSGGGTVTIISAATTNATLLSSSLKSIFSIHLCNTGTTWAYLKIYNKSSTPVPGTDTPIAVYGITPGGALVLTADTSGLLFGGVNGIGVAITGGAALNDTTPVSANQIVGTIIYN